MKNPETLSGAIQQNDNFLSVSCEAKIAILSESSIILGDYNCVDFIFLRYLNNILYWVFFPIRKNNSVLQFGITPEHLAFLINIIKEGGRNGN